MNRTDLINQIEEMESRIEETKIKLAARPDYRGADRWNRIINDPMVDHMKSLLAAMGPSDYADDMISLQKEISAYGIVYMLEKFQRQTA